MAVGLEYSAWITCDKCGSKETHATVVVTKLKPATEMHFVLPEGWRVTTRPDSGELLITCPTCPPTLVTTPPTDERPTEPIPPYED